MERDQVDSLRVQAEGASNEARGEALEKGNAGRHALLEGIPAWAPATTALDALTLAAGCLQRSYVSLRDSGDKADAQRIGRLALLADSLAADLKHTLEAIEAEASRPRSDE